MYILYFILNGRSLTLCVSSDIDKLKQYPKFDMDWMDLSTSDRVIIHGRTPSREEGWWLIEPVKHL